MSEPETRGRGHVLVVEDDASVRRLFVAALDAAGYATVAAETLAEASRVLEQGPEILAVLLDSGLPDGRGLTLLRQIRSGDGWVPVVVITGDEDEKTELEMVDAGATDFLVKPVSLDRLLTHLGARLRERATWVTASESGSAAGDVGARVIDEVIDAGAFAPVFQPIIDLREDRTVGFEALTRFDDGTPPDRRFHAAAAAGRGVALELATIDAAVTHAGALPDGVSVSINVAPGLLEVAAGELGDLVAPLVGRLVLEITEREVITDYDLVRNVIRGLGPGVGLSIGDAGAGFASLRHVVMLEPDYVKLDRAWVTDIHRLAANQAMVAGLVHFAGATGCTLVAEGIETAAERRCLVDLGVTVGQGYLLGRPEPVR